MFPPLSYVIIAIILVLQFLAIVGFISCRYKIVTELSLIKETVNEALPHRYIRNVGSIRNWHSGVKPGLNP